MAEIKSFPNNQDVYIGAEHVMRWLHGRTSGVFAAGNNCAVEAVSGAMQVTVSDGIGWLSDNEGNGIVWWNSLEDETSTKLTLDVGMADGALPRIDRVVVSWVTTNNTELPTIEVLAGTPSSTPLAPTLTNNSTFRQISLAQISVPAGITSITASNITDERLDASVCGLVTESIEIDTTVINSQWSALLTELQTALDNILEDHSIAASLVTYTNTSSGLEATTVQNAVDELKDGVDDLDLAIQNIDVLNQTYPVGAIYLSTVSTSPASLFGGTWTQIQDTFLLAAGSAYGAGSTGGSATVTLTVNQMPSHNHRIFARTRDITNTGSGYLFGVPQAYSDTGWVTVNTGGGQAHNNMPPYLAVYVWKRTA